MTTLVFIGRRSGETATVAANRRLREELASQRLSASAAADLCGVKQQWLSRRMTGTTDWALGELEAVCAALGFSFDYIATGIRELPTPPPPAAAGIQRDAQVLRFPNAATHASQLGDVSVEDDALAYVQLAEEGSESRLGESNPRPIHYE
ncbi:helix-turn-helix transcriptional regulator [Mycobacterium intracellulare]|uniref:helix-turn-helix domain-containing protein n=1 Tax=Mycobacterium intracellulare TaxID=1767 RepID=UPI001CD9D8B2|nr:helix-turn-helix transcriptional regulator [Mycobacterium intracellulare]MCA2324423.1 helix-turn-helix transcriptional regulator [Mycobacterium intracellulare]